MANTITTNLQMTGPCNLVNTSQAPASAAFSVGSATFLLNNIILGTEGGSHPANDWYCAKTTLAGSTPGPAASTTLDLTSLTNSLGNTVNFTYIKMVLIALESPGAGKQLTLGGAATSKFAGWANDGANTETITNWSVHSDTTGWTTTSANNLKIANSSTASVTFYVLIVGSTT